MIVKLKTNDTANILIANIYELDKLLGFKRTAHKRKPYRLTKKAITTPEHNSITVGRMGNNIKFEIRSEESHHNVAHFHISIRGAGSGSYRIDNLEPIHSNIEKSKEKMLLEWAKQHQQELVNIWNEFHGYRITVA